MTSFGRARVQIRSHRGFAGIATVDILYSLHSSYPSNRAGAAIVYVSPGIRYCIQDGVRRSVVACKLGEKTILATIYGGAKKRSRQRVALDLLYSTKDTIDQDKRYNSIVEGMRLDLALPDEQKRVPDIELEELPILAFGSNLIPIRSVALI